MGAMIITDWGLLREGNGLYRNQGGFAVLTPMPPRFAQQSPHSLHRAEGGLCCAKIPGSHPGHPARRGRMARMLHSAIMLTTWDQGPWVPLGAMT